MMSTFPIEIQPYELSELRQSSESHRLVDCREDDEFYICKIDGAKLVPLSQWAEIAMPQLPDRSERIIIYCHHGVRSMRATQFLRQHGYSHVQSLHGGIDLWSEMIDQTVPRY
jgi:rhodanese-related sulfurtransferase